jgi:phosphoribosyl 1,2-cyclic phosphodiesterase
MGVPQLGCRCAVCTSNNPRNHRTRPSIHLQQGNTRVLIDAPPELRLQLLATRLDEHLNAVLITHTHADHIMGLDDVRGFTLRTGKPMPVYAEASALHDLRRVFHYVFHPFPPGTITPQIEFREIPAVGVSLQIGEMSIEPLRVFHGEMPILAFRVGQFAYVTDVSYIPPETLLTPPGAGAADSGCVALRAAPDPLQPGAGVANGTKAAATPYPLHPPDPRLRLRDSERPATPRCGTGLRRASGGGRMLCLKLLRNRQGKEPTTLSVAWYPRASPEPRPLCRQGCAH